MRNVWKKLSLTSIAILSLPLISIQGTLYGGSVDDESLPSDTPTNEAIDYYIDETLELEKIKPAAIVDDANLVRRLTLDLGGRIPSAAEARAFVKSRVPQKWTLLVDRLLSSPDFAYHQRNELDMMLLADKDNDESWRTYLLAAVAENRPWDRMFREMLEECDDEPEKKPSLTFLRVRAKNLDDLTNDTSRIFFGVNISCAKCHDHPLVEDWKQDHFYGMASFFNRTYLTKKNTLAEKSSGKIKFKTTAGDEKQASFMFLSGATVVEPVFEKTDEQRKAEDAEVKRQMKDESAPPPKPPQFNARSKLVELALQSNGNQFFARSIVNRVWARFMGYGLVDPLDQMHSGNEPSHPELLDWLSADLIAHGYDLKRLVRGIVLSDTYARTSRWQGGGEAPAAMYFAFAQSRPLSPRQYSLSLQIAGDRPDSFTATPDPEQWKQRRERLEKAAEGLASLIETPGEYFQISVDEALLFSNSDRIHNDFLQDSKDHLIGFLRECKTRPQAIEEAFWAVFSRPPEADEAQALHAYLVQRQDSYVSALQQVAWALMTSPELRFNY